MVAMDPYTGRVLAMVGGFSYAESEFNRATQAWRQPGSSFKPFVYSAALDNGYTPSSVIMDAPIEIRAGNEVWRPVNYGGKFYGPATLRTGIEKSRNVMTVRLAQDMGMPLVAEYAKRFGIYDEPRRRICRWRSARARRRCCAWSPPMRPSPMAAARSTPTLIDRIQDRYGRTIYQHDQRKCEGCERDRLDRPGRARAGRQPRAGARPDDRLPDHLDDGRRGEARHRDRRARRSASRSPARPAPPTTRRMPGSSASRPTSWSASSSATTSRGRWGRAMTGGVLAAPIFTEFMKVALKDAPPKEFQVPPGIELIPIDRRTGLRAHGGGRRRHPRSLQAGHGAAHAPTRSSATRIPWACRRRSRRRPTGPFATGTGGLY